MKEEMTTTAWDETTRALVRNTREKEKHKHFGTVHDYSKFHGNKLSTITFKSFLLGTLATLATGKRNEKKKTEKNEKKLLMMMEMNRR